MKLPRWLLWSMVSLSVVAILVACLWWLPRWIGYQDCAEFARLVGPLPRPGETDDIRKLLPEDFLAWESFGVHVFVSYWRESVFYVIQLDIDDTGEWAHTVRIYRIEVPLAPYEGRTKLSGYYGERGEQSRAVGDFVAFLGGDSDAAVGLRHKLIYLAPPSSG